MDDLSSDLLTLIFKLLPGFLTAWVFYGLTAFRRPSAFERLVQALIFTAIIQVLTWGTQIILEFLGQFHSFGEWDQKGALATSIVIALILGLVVSWIANNNWIHDKLWRLGFTAGSSYPSNWYKTLAQQKRFVVLHLIGGRRLYGWPADWPDYPDDGHFVITLAEWLLDDGSRAPLYQVERCVVPANEVEMVEFVKDPSEVKATDEEITQAKNLLMAAQTKEIT